MIKRPDFGTECPLVPEGATDYERQEISRHWLNVYRYLTDAVRRCEVIAESLSPEAAHKVVVERAYTLPDALVLANATQDIAKATADLASLQVCINAVIHRMAIEHKAAEKQGG